MVRFMMSVSVAALGLALLVVPETRAEGRAGGGSGPHMGSSSGESHRGPGHFDYRFPNRSYHGFKADHRFGYDRYGYRSLRWSDYRYSSEYRCYLYWAPSYRCWFFYEPAFSYYVPVSYYRKVYPEFTPTVAPVVTSPSVVQQTTVVVAPPTPVAPVAETVAPGPVPPVAPAPTAVQNTKVGPGAP